MRSKQRILISGRAQGGGSFGRGALYHLLQNRIYRGEAVHKGVAYPGEHKAIVDEELWRAVQDRLAANRTIRRKSRIETGALLGGLIYDDRGNIMSPTYSIRRGNRYRYYISSALLHDRRPDAGSLARINADDVERLVVAVLGRELSRPELLADGPSAGWSAETRTLVRDTVERVVIQSGQVQITRRPAATSAAGDPPRRRRRPAAGPCRAVAGSAASCPKGDHCSLPIRLLPTPPTCRVLPGSGVKLCVGRCGDVARDAEQGTEGVERIEPPVEAEGEFVEVGLQVLVTDPVMDAVQPRFQVCEDEMDDWQILLGDLRIAPFSDGEVFVAALGEAGVAAPVVGDERRARHNGALNEAAERLRAAVRHDGEPNPPGIATTLPLVELGARLALANLHSAGDKNLIVDATAFAARPAASPGFIDFDVLAGPAADPVLIRAHHPRAELVEDLERRLVARQAKLSPKLHGRHAGCLAGHQIGRPKPYAQRRVRARHDRSHRQSGVTAALAAAQDARTICEAERLSRRLTMGANKPVAPASLLQVGGAGRVVGKKSLELWERLWEPKIATLVNVHEHGRTLPLVAVGDNRIGKHCSI